MDYIARLKAIQRQDYPLEITSDDAAALVASIRRIMAEVSEDDKVFAAFDYNLVTSALSHPTSPYGGGSQDNLPV